MWLSAVRSERSRAAATSVFSHLIIYDPAKRPTEVRNVLQSAGDIASLLADG